MFLPIPGQDWGYSDDPMLSIDAVPETFFDDEYGVPSDPSDSEASGEDSEDQDLGIMASQQNCSQGGLLSCAISLDPLPYYKELEISFQFTCHNCVKPLDVATVRRKKFVRRPLETAIVYPSSKDQSELLE